MAGTQTPPSAYSQVFNCSCSSSPSSGSLLPKSLWVKLAVGQPVKVPTENCDDIADLVDAIKHKLQNSLAKVDCNRIYLQLSEDTNPLDPALSMLELVQLPKFQNTSTAPLLAKVTASSDDVQSAMQTMDNQAAPAKAPSQSSSSQSRPTSSHFQDPCDDIGSRIDILRRNHYRLTQLLYIIQSLMSQFFRLKFRKTYGKEWNGDDTKCRKLILSFKKLNQEQRKYVETGDLLLWDLSLFCAVFLHGRLSMTKDEIKLTRKLLSVRNACMHASKGTLTNEEFKMHWGTATEVLKSLPGGAVVDTEAIAQPVTTLAQKSLEASIFDDNTRRFIREQIMTGQYDIQRYIFVKAEDSLSYIPPYMKFSISEDEWKEDHALLNHVQKLRQMLDYVCSKGDNELNMIRVVIYHNVKYSYWCYCIYQVNLLRPSEDKIFNEVGKIPSEKFVSDEISTRDLAACINPYTGNQTNFECIQGYLIQAGVDLETESWKRRDEIFRAMEWLVSKRYPGRLVNRITTYGLTKIAHNDLSFSLPSLDNSISSDAMKIALVALGYRIKLLGDDGIDVLSNAHRVFE